MELALYLFINLLRKLIPTFAENFGLRIPEWLSSDNGPSQLLPWNPHIFEEETDGEVVEGKRAERDCRLGLEEINGSHWKIGSSHCWNFKRVWNGTCKDRLVLHYVW